MRPSPRSAPSQRGGLSLAAPALAADAPRAEVSLSVTADAPSYPVGDTVRYTATATSSGASPLSRIGVVIPAGVAPGGCDLPVTSSVSPYTGATTLTATGPFAQGDSLTCEASFAASATDTVSHAFQANGNAAQPGDGSAVKNPLPVRQVVDVEVLAAPDPGEPVIGTSLVDSADGDRVLPWNGGTVIDTVAYENLIPGIEYTVTGELMDKADGSATGITGSVTFTPESANGSVDVTFVVPEGNAGKTFVAFEQLFEGAEAAGEPVAVHEDIEDAAQTVVVEEAPAVEIPIIGTSLVDSADGDHEIEGEEGAVFQVVDTAAYRNLVPGQEYTVTGELQDKSSGTATGVTGSTTFTPESADGSVDVVFDFKRGSAQPGDQLVAFEWLFEGGTAGEKADAVAQHTDIEDLSQTVTLVEGETPTEPSTPTESEEPTAPEEPEAPIVPVDDKKGAVTGAPLASTGANPALIGFGSLLGAALVAAGAALVMRRRERALTGSGD